MLYRDNNNSPAVSKRMFQTIIVIESGSKISIFSFPETQMRLYRDKEKYNMDQKYLETPVVAI